MIRKIHLSESAMKLNTVLLVTVFVTTVMFGCSEGTEMQRKHIYFPETGLGIEIPYTVEEFFTIREELIEFTKNYGLIPSHDRGFLSDDENISSSSLWMVKAKSNRREDTKIPVIATFMNKRGVLQINFVEDYFDNEDSLNIVAEAFIKQFAERKGKDFNDVTHIFALPKGIDKYRNKIVDKEEIKEVKRPKKGGADHP